MGFWIYYRDDRGDCPPGGHLRTAGMARRAGVPKDAAGRAMRRVNAQRMLIGVVFGSSVLAVSVVASVWSGPGGSNGGYLLATLVVMFVALALLPIVASRVMGAHKLGFLKEGYCPACGYSIAELESEADGCRVCPECGSAWKLDADTSDAEA